MKLVKSEELNYIYFIPNFLLPETIQREVSKVW